MWVRSTSRYGTVVPDHPGCIIPAHNSMPTGSTDGGAAVSLTADRCWCHERRRTKQPARYRLTLLPYTYVRRSHIRARFRPIAAMKGQQRAPCSVSTACPAHHQRERHISHKRREIPGQTRPETASALRTPRPASESSGKDSSLDPMKAGVQPPPAHVLPRGSRAPVLGRPAADRISLWARRSGDECVPCVESFRLMRCGLW